MPAEKYSAQLDQILCNLVKKQSKNLASQDKIAFSEELCQKGHFQKVAFDVYRVDNDPYRDLWMLQDVDGSPYLVRASDPQFDNRELGAWSALSNYDKDSITLNYKNIPVVRFSSTEYNFGPDEIMTFKSAILSKIEEDETFIKDLLKNEPEAKRTALAESFPELKKYI